MNGNGHKFRNKSAHTLFGRALMEILNQIIFKPFKKGVVSIFDNTNVLVGIFFIDFSLKRVTLKML